MGPSRQALQLLKDSAANKDFGRSTQVCICIYQANIWFQYFASLWSCIKIQILLLVSQAIPKRKQWNATQTRGPKRVKVEVKSTQTEESQSSVGGMSAEAYDLMVKGKNLFEI